MDKQDMIYVFECMGIQIHRPWLMPKLVPISSIYRRPHFPYRAHHVPVSSSGSSLDTLIAGRCGELVLGRGWYDLYKVYEG
jgi:hypothetical protein